MAVPLTMTDKHQNWREDFPIFQSKMNGKPLVYLDTASSAQKPNAVIDKMTSLMNSHYSNIHRGLYAISQNLTEEYEAVRSKVSRFLNISSDYSVVFTRNTTEAINLVAQSWGNEFLEEGSEIILSELEHHANIVPWQLISEQKSANVKYIPLIEDQELNLEEFKKLLSDKTKIVCVNHISNSLGIINNIQAIIAITKEFNPNIKVLIDGSQSVVHGSVDLSQIGADFYVFTGHKLYGPTGVGCLVAKTSILEQMPPYQGGGDMIETVSFDSSTFKEPPYKFEAGTPAIMEVIGLGAAIDYLSSKNMDDIAEYEHNLLLSASVKMRELDGMRIYADIEGKAPIISFTAEWAHISDIAMILDQCGVAVRSGHHCCMPLMQKFGIEGTIRASFGLYNTMEDIDIFIDGLNKAKKMLA